ncbi:MAG: hypothetical protein RLZZ299_1886 [Pseudomonadota bacterium]|jgi:hypothetical protein
MVLSLLGLALAAPALPVDAVARHDALLAAFDAHFAPGAHAPETGTPVHAGCLTGLVASLKQDWDLFSPAERARMTRTLAPWKADLVEVPASPPPPPSATESCFGTQKANALAGERFVVEYDDGISESNVQRLLTALEFSYDKEVTELGWRAPMGAGNCLLPVYIEPSNQQSAYTTVDRCATGYCPYIVAYSGSFADLSWADTMAAHEFNHALQYSYGVANEFWWWEATATYVEESVYPTSNWWAYYVTGYAENPHLSLNASDQQDQDIFWHMYGMAIWAFYLDEYQGGLDTVQGAWEAARRAGGRNEAYYYGAWDALEDLGIDFDAAYLDFAVRNATMDYEAHRILPAVKTVGRVRALPASDTVAGGARPQGYGQNYIPVDGGLGAGILRLTVTGDEAVAWGGAIVATADGRALRAAVTSAEAGTPLVVELPDYAGEELMLMVTPLARNERPRSYDWSLEIVPPPVEEVEDDKGMFGCSAVPGAAGTVPVLVGVGLALVGRRSRRRPLA